MMDLNSFKLLKEDDSHYEVGHPNGKSIRVKKSGLNDKAKKLVEKLRGKNNYDEGGAVSAPPQDAVDQSSNVPEYLSPNDASNVPPNMLPGDGSSGPTEGAAVIQPPAQTPVVANPEIKTPEADVTPTVAAVPAAAASGENAVLDKAMTVKKSLEEQKKYGSAEAQAAAAQGQEEAKVVNQALGKISLMDTAQQQFQKYQDKDNQLAKAFMETKIDPKRYYNNMSTGAKIVSGIGMLLGGADAVKIVDNAVQKDIESQRNDQDKKMTLWKMNREAFGNDMQANLATQNQMYTALKYQLQAVASKYSSPQVQARQGAVNSLLDQKIGENNQKLSYLDIGLGKTAGNQQQALDPSALVPMLVPPERQKEAFDELERAQNTKHSSPAIMDAFDKAATEVRPFGGDTGNFFKASLMGTTNALTLGHGMEAPHAKAFEAEMGPTFSKIEGTVRQAAMDNMNKNLKPQFGDSDATIAVKRKALQNYLESTKSAPTLKGYGIDLSKFGSTAVDNSKPEVKTMNGIPYVKVQGGWKRQ